MLNLHALPITHLRFLQGCHATAQHSGAISADLHEEFLVLPEGKGEAGPIHYQPVLDYVVILYSNKGEKTGQTNPSLFHEGHQSDTSNAL